MCVAEPTTEDISAASGYSCPQSRAAQSYRLSGAKAKKSDENFAAKILSDLGCINIADEVEILLDTLSAEAILKENPEYIFVSVMGDYNNSKAYMEELLQKKEYAMLDAVKNGKVYFLPKELFQYKPCSRWAESYRYISSILNNE